MQDNKATIKFYSPEMVKEDQIVKKNERETQYLEKSERKKPLLMVTHKNTYNGVNNSKLD